MVIFSVGTDKDLWTENQKNKQERHNQWREFAEDLKDQIFQED